MRAVASDGERADVINRRTSVQGVRDAGHAANGAGGQRLTARTHEEAVVARRAAVGAARADLQLKGADVDGAKGNSWQPALIGREGISLCIDRKRVVPRIDGRAAGQQGHGLRGAAVVAERAQQGNDGIRAGPNLIAVGAIADARQISAADADEVVLAAANDGPVNFWIRSAGIAGNIAGNDHILDRQGAVIGNAGGAGGEVAADRGVAHRCRGPDDLDGAAVRIGNIGGESGVAHGHRGVHGHHPAIRDDAAAVGSGVARKGGVAHRQRSGTEDAAAFTQGSGEVVGDGGIADGQRTGVVDAAAEATVDRVGRIAHKRLARIAIHDGQTG